MAIRKTLRYPGCRLEAPVWIITCYHRYPEVRLQQSVLSVTTGWYLFHIVHRTVSKSVLAERNGAVSLDNSRKRTGQVSGHRCSLGLSCESVREIGRMSERQTGKTNRGIGEIVFSESRFRRRSLNNKLLFN